MTTQWIPDELYTQILANVPICCVDIALVSKGTILLVKRSDQPAKNEWWVPGGRVMKGELMQETAARKCIEEVGIECFIGPIVHTAETIFPHGPNDIPVHSINSCFLAYPKEATERLVTLDNHSYDYKWVGSVAEVTNLHTYVIECLKGAGLK